jgi:glutathione S-transferase
MHSEIMDSQLQKAYDAIESATSQLTEAQMRQHPPGKWDTAAILEHLALTFGSTARVMSKCITAGEPMGTSSTLKNHLARIFVVRFSYIPTGRKAPTQVVPAGMSGNEARELIKANLKMMDDALNQCEQRFGSSAKIANHPVLGPIPVKHWRKFHLLHTLHHMKQIHGLVQEHPAAQNAVGTPVETH